MDFDMAEKVIMLGNEAIARGAYEAGVKVSSAYPGTPSTEISEYLVQYKDDVYEEWAPNEKVATEVAVGASLAGVRSMACMKHVGLNVAADPDRLFVVEGGGVVVKVHGTVFNMKAREKQDHVDVSLLSGLVVVENHGVSRSLNPGETAVCKKSVPSIEKKTTDVSISCLWAKESLRFEKKTIYELTGYLSEWYGMDIRLDPSLPTDQAYTFTITHESLEEVLCLIAKITPIEYVFDEDNTVRITRK